MIIKEKKKQHRRDFTAVYKCEHCGHTYEGSGYDDRNFHENVLPDRECQECGESSNSKRSDETVTRKPRYPEHLTV